MKFIVIDGAGIVYRSFYGLPRYLKSRSGEPTNAVLGFANILINIVKEHKPDYLAVAFDHKGKTFRHDSYAEYKATRVKAPDELYAQIPRVKEVIDAFDVPLFEMEGFEADDLIATIVKTLSERNIDILIATGDFDLFQLADTKVKILYPTKGFKEAEILGSVEVLEKYGFYAEQIPDYKGLHGDSSDNIPGVYGIGEKTATDLLKKYKHLEDIYARLDELPEKLRAKLSAGEKEAFFSRELARLKNDVPISLDLERCEVGRPDIEKIKPLFEELGFRKLLDRIAQPDENQQSALF